jgi:hypothetical protein
MFNTTQALGEVLDIYNLPINEDLNVEEIPDLRPQDRPILSHLCIPASTCPAAFQDEKVLRREN